MKVFWEKVRRDVSVDSMASSEFDSQFDSISGSPEDPTADVAASIIITCPSSK